MSAGQSPTSPILKARIEAYTGPLNIIASDYIKQSVAKVLNLIPVEALMPHATYVSNVASGASLTNRKLLMAGIGGNLGRQVTEIESGRYRDENSIYYATGNNPVYYLAYVDGEQKVFTIPEDGDIVVADYSAVAESDVTIKCLPPQFTEAVVLDVAIGLLQAQLASAERALLASPISDVNTAITNDLKDTSEDIELALARNQQAQTLVADRKESIEANTLLMQTIQALQARFNNFFAPFQQQEPRQ